MRIMTTVIGFLGMTKDRPHKRNRWDAWRPSVAVCQHEDLLVDRFDILTEPRFAKLCEEVVADIGTVSPETSVHVHEVSIADPWDFEQVYGTLHRFTREYDWNPEREDYYVHMTTGTHVAQICWYLLTESRHLPGRLLQTAPPTRKSHPSHGTYTIIDLDLSRYDQIAQRFEVEQSEAITVLKSGIETRNAEFNRQVEQIERVAVASAEPVLLTGPTGAGKSQLARRIFELRRHRHLVAGDFVEVNCATLRGDAAMSALFGHTKGAFTGAAAARAGLLRAADAGILFLDEIGELGLDEQAMLLRALEEKRFLPVGADREVESDFQLIAGTNRDLVDQVGRGGFREDLLARINLWTFRLPGLSERREDIEPNLDYELDEYARRTGKRVTFNREARERYLAFATGPARWSGNFRDLNASVTRMATLCPGGRIDEAAVREEIERLTGAWGAPARAADDLDALMGEGASELDRFDRVQLADVVRVCRESRSLSEAGRTLFARSRERRTTRNDADRVRKYLARFGLEWSALRQTGRGTA